jgi:MinD superfamily P-loop ATPase
MNIAVLSGKGGTGKTFVSVNLSCVAGRAAYVDCDVEEPNGHLFFKPQITRKTPVTVSIPQVDAAKCTGCRVCVDFCQFNALALIRQKLMVFQEICHSCGGCVLFCPEKALEERQREIGRIEEGQTGRVSFLSGCLNTGEVSGVPIIRKMMSMLPGECTAVFDCPPGSACAVMESILKADYCLLVAEPTLFGVHNLAMVHELVRLFGKPFGAVLNKCLPGSNPAQRFCEEHNIPVLAKIPYDQKLGRINSQGLVAVRESRRYQALFVQLLKCAAKGAAV